MSGGIENRRTPRAPIELRVEYQRMNAFFADYTRNISKGGAFIKTAEPLPEGTRFVFRLGLPGFSEPFSLEGEVIRVVRPGGSEEPGMGVRFLFDDDGRRAAFEQTVEQLMLDHLGPEVFRQLLGRVPPGHR